MEHKFTFATVKKRVIFCLLVSVFSLAIIPVLGNEYHSLLDTTLKSTTDTVQISGMKQELSDIVVTGEYAPISSKSAVYNVTTISKSELQAKGATNLREALDNKLGVNLSQDNVFGSSASLNGISGEGIKILVNGVPMVGRIDGKIDLSQINMNNVERIEIVKGPLSVLYGSDALGGVINLITKNQKNTWNVFAKGFYESVGQYNVSVGGGANIKKGFISFDAGRNFFDGYSVRDTSRHKEWRPKEQYFANTKFGFALDHLKVWAELSFFRELMIDRGDLRPYTTYAFDQHFTTYRPMATLGASYVGRDNLQLDVTAGYSGFYRAINNYKKDLVTLSETVRQSEDQDTTIYHQLNIRPVLMKKFIKQKIQIQTGLDISQLWTEQNRIQGNKKQMGDYALFASLQYFGIKGFTIQPAGRLLFNSQFGISVMPSVNARLKAGEYVTLRASYGMGYRAPSLKELYLDFKDSNHDIVGNPNLKPENSHNFSLGLDFCMLKKNHDISFTNQFSYNSMYNKIDLAVSNPNTLPVTYQYFNIKRYNTVSGEHELNYRFKRVYAGVGVMYLLSKVQTGTSSNEIKLWSPDATVKLGYKIPKAEINIDVWYKYNGKKLLYAINSSIQAGTRGDYHSLNVSASKSFWKNRIQLTVGGKNLLGVTNVNAQNVSAIGHSFSGNSTQVNWGRTFFCSLAFEFSK